jgi:hypothetical protein
VQNAQINSIDGNKVTGTVANANTAVTANNSNNLGGLPTQRFVKFDLDGTVSIGTTGTGSTLTVGGVIESTAGGIKFPDGSQQTSAGLTAVTTNSTLTGDGTNASPLGINSPIMVRDLDNPARQPFQMFLNPGANNVSVLIVPQNKTLVLEFISGFVTKPTAETSASILLRLYENGQWLNLDYNFFLRAQHFSGCCRVYDIVQPLRLYVGPGQELRIMFDTNTLDKKITFTGYFVDSFPSSLNSGGKTNVQKK